MNTLSIIIFILKINQAIPWSYVKIDPKTSMPLRDEEGNYQWEGYCIDFAKRLSEKLDFDYVLVPPRAGLFGDRVPGLSSNNNSGEWDGLVGDLITGVNKFLLLNKFLFCLFVSHYVNVIQNKQNLTCGKGNRFGCCSYENDC